LCYPEVLVLDLAGILFSSIMMLIVIVRAMRLDRTQPWFQAISVKDSPPTPGAKPWQRRG
jgi:hypothetical protein